MTLLLRENEPLAARTTFGVGGPARYFAEADDEASVLEALDFARERGLPVLALGGGSNLLVADRGVDALVLRARLRGISEQPGGTGAGVVEVGAGETWDGFVKTAVVRGWAGVECLSGIPGEVGAAPIQNVGAYGQEVAETLTAVRAIERVTGRIVGFDASACRFGYRDSVFKREERERHVITRVTFSLRPGGPPSIRYPELARRLEAAGDHAPTLVAVRDAVLNLRRGKSMVLDPSDENRRSAGSFFVNPTLDTDDFARARGRIEAAGVLAPHESIPHFPAAERRVKLSAGWLIERAGFRKGEGDLNVGLSTRHALAVVNRGFATAQEIVAFAARVRDGVLERFGVVLSAEPVLVGFRLEETAGLVRGPDRFA